MPAGALVRIPRSLSRNAKLLTNLRGIDEVSPYDFASPSRSFTVVDLRQTAVTGGGTWANTIQWQYENLSQATDTFIGYPSLLSNATTFTLLFRIKLKAASGSPNTMQIIFFNGLFDPITPSFNGYSVEYNSNTNRILFNPFITSSVVMNTLTLTTDTWYHYGLKVTTSTTTVVDVWENGTYSGPYDLGAVISTPTGSTSLFSFTGAPIAVGLHGCLTDVVFLEGTDLTADEMAAFAEAPYI